jgi:hypothetical protein
MTFPVRRVIVHNADLNLHEAAIYGALGLTVAAGDPGGDRVYPPLRGAANGADGGPLLTVRGEALTMTFTPTGFQPGQVFTLGDTLALSGQVAPTLPARVTAEVSKPSGLTLVTRGQANAVGYIYDPVQNLPLDEPGVWRIRLRVAYDGLTSTGMVQPPAAGAPLSDGTLPGGTVLGAVDSTFAIYVLPEDGSVIQLTNPMIVDGRVPAAQPFNVVAAVPEGWTNIQAEYTVTMPGTILEEGQQPPWAASSLQLRPAPDQPGLPQPGHQRAGRDAAVGRHGDDYLCAARDRCRRPAGYRCAGGDPAR